MRKDIYEAEIECLRRELKTALAEIERLNKIIYELTHKGDENV